MWIRCALLLLLLGAACAPSNGSDDGDAGTETGTSDGACEPNLDTNWVGCDEGAPCVSESADLGNPGPWIQRPLAGSFFGAGNVDVVRAGNGAGELQVVRDVFGAREISTLALDGEAFHDGATRVRIDDDDLDDVAVILEGPYALRLFLGSSDSGLESHATIPVAFGATPADVGIRGADIDKDTELDFVLVAWSAAGSEVVAWTSGTGDFTTSSFSVLAYTVDRRASERLATADFDGDGDLDLAFPTIEGTQVARGLGDGSFEDWAMLPALEHYSLATAILDGTTFLLAATGDALVVSHLEGGEWSTQSIAFDWASCPSETPGPEDAKLRWPGQLVVRDSRVLVLQDQNPIIGGEREAALALHDIQLAADGAHSLTGSHALSWTYGGCCGFDWLVDPGEGPLYVQVLDGEHHEVAGMLDPG
jgi:hypothetical protein